MFPSQSLITFNRDVKQCLNFFFGYSSLWILASTTNITLKPPKHSLVSLDTHTVYFVPPDNHPKKSCVSWSHTSSVVCPGTHPISIVSPDMYPLIVVYLDMYPICLCILKRSIVFPNEHALRSTIRLRFRKKHFWPYFQTIGKFPISLSFVFLDTHILRVVYPYTDLLKCCVNLHMNLVPHHFAGLSSCSSRPPTTRPTRAWRKSNLGS